MAFTKAQQKAIQHNTGPAIVLAGPGSGKTTVITNRVSYLIDQYQVNPAHILVVTFTRAAAEEMKQRFLTMHHTSRTTVRFGTFHSVFFQMLKLAYHLTGANIASEEQTYTFLKEIIRQMNLKTEEEADFYKNICAEISSLKTGQIALEHFYSATVSDETFRRIYTAYQKKMEQENLIDYDDIILFTWELLSQRADILESWREQYQYILIDEFQDINKLQYDIVKLLAAPRNNLFIVGDDDQSIYRFRGSKPEIMLNFPKEYPQCEEIHLSQNFRCPGNVVQSASQMIGRNITRYDKKITAVKPPGAPVQYLTYRNQTQESLAIIHLIQEYQRRGYCLSQMAVLYRNNQDARIISQRFLEYNISLRSRETLPNIYEHWIASDLIGYLKAASGNRERSLFLQIANKPKRYLSRECFDQKQISFDRLRMLHAQKDWILKRINQFETDLYVLHQMDPYSALQYICNQIGYHEYLTEYCQYRNIPLEDLMDLCNQIQESARGFQTTEEWFSHISDYSAMLLESGKKQDPKTDAVTFSTLHSSKGLEYPIVFIIDVNEGIIPYKKARMLADIEEERRMFYVGMTRAQEYLHICSIKEKNGKELNSSPFLLGLSN